MEWKYASSHFLLAALYLIPITLCWLWRVRRQNGAPDFWRVAFTSMIFIGSITRGSFWFVQPFHVSGMFVLNQLVLNYWAMFPGLFICTDYLVILFLWIQIYHGTEENPVDMKPQFLFLTGIMFLIAFSLMIGDFITTTNSDKQVVITYNTTLQQTMVLFVASMYLLGSIGYMVYGMRFYLRLSRRPFLIDKIKNKILPRVLIVSSICGICFTTRAILVLLDSFFNIFSGHQGDRDRQEFYWWFDPVYYIPLEIAPLILMLKLFTPQKEEEEEISFNDRNVSGWE